MSGENVWLCECEKERAREQHGKSQRCESRNFSPALASQLTRPKSWAQIFVERKVPTECEKRITKTTKRKKIASEEEKKL